MNILDKAQSLFDEDKPSEAVELITTTLPTKNYDVSFVSRALDLLAFNSCYKDALKLYEKYAPQFPESKLLEWMDWKKENLQTAIDEGKRVDSSIVFGQSGQLTTRPLYSLKIDGDGILITEKRWAFSSRLQLHKIAFSWKSISNIVVETWRPVVGFGGGSTAAYKGIKLRRGLSKYTIDLTPSDSPFTYPNKVLQALKKYSPSPIPIYKYKYLLSYGWYFALLLIPIMALIVIAILPPRAIPLINTRTVDILLSLFTILLLAGGFIRKKIGAAYI
jgi:hypothetical protein